MLSTRALRGRKRRRDNWQHISAARIRPPEWPRCGDLCSAVRPRDPRRRHRRPDAFTTNALSKKIAAFPARTLSSGAQNLVGGGAMSDDGYTPLPRASLWFEQGFPVAGSARTGIPLTPGENDRQHLLGQRRMIMSTWATSLPAAGCEKLAIAGLLIRRLRTPFWLLTKW